MFLAVSATSLVTCVSRYTRNLLNKSDTEKYVKYVQKLTNWENWDMYKTKTQLRETERKLRERGLVSLLIYTINFVYYAKLRDGSLIFNWRLWFAPTRYHASTMRSMTSIGQHLQVLLLTTCVKIAYSRVIARVHCPLDLCYSSILFFRCPFQIDTQSSR
jgi:hypothetical protein